MTTFTFTAFENADLFAAGHIARHAQFTLPHAATLEIKVDDNDTRLSGDAFFNEFGDDLFGQSASLTRASDDTEIGNGGTLYAEQVWHVYGDNGETYRLVELEQPGSLPDSFTFLGDVPPAGTLLTVGDAANVTGKGLPYEDLSAGELPAPAPNIVEIAAGSDDFNILVKALETANLVETVQNANDITVFAPTDAAFTQLAVDLGFDGDESNEDAVFGFIAAALAALDPNGDPIPLLTDILTYHVSPGAKTADEIDAADEITTLLNGATFSTEGAELIDNEPDIGNPSIVTRDIPASNGKIQVIDKVLLPIDIPGNEPNIVEIAAGSDDFTILVKALETANLVETVQNSNDITVFAPTDAAFTQLAVDLGYEGDESDEDGVFGFIASALAGLDPNGDPIPLLTNILTYHVSPGAKTAAEIDAADQVPTLLSGATFGTEGTELVDNEPDIENPNIVMPDIMASNGTVQVIDRVLLPIDIPGNEDPLPTLTGLVAASGGVFDDNAGDFDLLLNAVQAADLAGALDDPDAEFTVFAPTDAAFVGLAQTLGFEGGDEGEAFAYLVEALSLLNHGDPIPLLTDILLFHVAPEPLDEAAVLSATEIETLLSGATLGVEGTSLVDADPDIPNPNLIETDIEASNGIAHAIDGVLLPVDVLQSDGSNDVDFLIADDKSNLIHTGRDNDFVDGNGGKDFIFLGRGDDVGFGGDGKDKIFGGKGNDVLKGGDGHDIVGGGSGDDMVSGGAGKDRIFGAHGNDTLIGDAGDDIIKGGSGDDHIVGGAGNDKLLGGSGADVFKFNTGDGHDVVKGFKQGVDLIDLSGSDIDSFEELMGVTQTAVFGTHIDLGDDQSLFVSGHGIEFTSDDFIF